METRVFYHDTDAGGVVYYGRYLNFLEEARTEFLESKGLSVLGLLDRGFTYAVRKCTLTYKSPARYGDTLICTATLKQITAAQLIFDQTIVEKNTARLIVHAEVALASLNRDFKAIQIPDDIRATIVKKG